MGTKFELGVEVTKLGEGQKNSISLMMRFLCILVATCTVSPVFAWTAKCQYPSSDIEIVSPPSPFDLFDGSIREIQFIFQEEEVVRLGELSTWLTRCQGEACNTSQIGTFELNTFSERGLLYCSPSVD